MEAGNAGGSGLVWLSYAMTTVVAWGVYGVFLHTGTVAMGDPAHGRTKAFLLVGVAYFLTAVVAPILLLQVGRASWQFPLRGVAWSLAAGLVGAVGALCVLLAFGAKGSPPVVMSIVFAGAPIVNAAVALAMHPPAGGWLRLRWQFLLGIALAALGGCLVTLYRPAAAAVVPRAAQELPVQSPAGPR
jgi:hypothetical protein